MKNQSASLHRFVPIRVLAALLVVFAAGARLPAKVVPLGFSGGQIPAGVTMSENQEIERIVFEDKVKLPAAQLGKATGETFSLEFWMRVESEALLNHPDGWTDTFPLAVFGFVGPNNQRMFMRLPKGRVSVVATTDGKNWPVMQSPAPIEANQWYHVVLTRSGILTKLYINGVLGAASESLPRLTGMSSITFGRQGDMRHFVGTLARPRVHDGLLGEAEIKALVGERPAETGGAALSAPPLGAPVSFGRYPVLRVAKGEMHPLIDQLEVSATVVRWRGPQLADLLVCGDRPQYAGWRPALYRQKGVDHRGLPFYDEGTTIKGLPGTGFFSVVRNDGREHLFARSVGSPYGDNNLLCYTKDTAAGLEFGAIRNVTIDGRSFEQAFGRQLDGWWVGDIDGDGVPDLLVTAIKSDGTSYWPDKEGMWAGVERKNSGKGRGYDVQGEWLGNLPTSILYWAKGRIDSSGELVFVEKKPVHYRQTGFDAQWRSSGGPCAVACVKIAGRPVILQTGSVDRILAMPFVLKNGELIVESSHPLLEGGASLLETYAVRSISVLEEKSDGTLRLLLDGNPGRLVVLEGKEIGRFRELGSLLTQGGPVAVDALGTPSRHDWDGDGLDDLIIGDSAGWLTLWRGTKDPMVYHAGVPMTSGGKVVHHQAGLTGSIQGPGEKRFGYLQPTVGDWDGNGKAVIIASDITGMLTLYRATDKPADLTEPVVLTKDGKPYEAAWRSRPAIIPAKMNFAGSGLPALLHTDWDGELAVAIPDGPGSTNIARVVKLAYADGKPILVCGPCGSWGRAELSIVDWNGDGKWDIVFGTIHRNQIHYSSFNSGASPYWLENVGTNKNPVFAPARRMELKDGSRINLGIHTASVFPTDLNGDGTPDLIVGPEDGKIYYFLRSELKQ